MTESFSRVSVIGLGYIGLPTAAMIADHGVEVIGVDINRKAVETINRGGIHIVEPDLDVIVQRAVKCGKLKAVTEPQEAQAFIIAVPTPFKGEYEPDLSYIESAAKAIAPKLKKGNLVILESTSPVGTTEKLAGWLAAARPDLKFPGSTQSMPDIFLAYCPERVLPGNVIRELKNNDRIVGGMTATCAARASALYRVFVEGKILVTDSRTAEMAKLTENAYRDVNIAFANELSLICDRLGINVWELVRLANHHPRVKILNPGPGVGGHCIAVDPWFIVSSAPKEARLIRTAREVNNHKPHYVVERIVTAAAKRKSPVVAILGLSYKADIDDLRESPAVEIALAVHEKGVGELLLVEPHVEELPPQLQGLNGVEFVEMETAIERANVVVLLVDHSVFKNIGKDRLTGVEIVDTRGFFE